jgi:outer membrane protein TolC
MFTAFIKYCTLSFALGCSVISYAQSQVMDQYIQEAFSANQGLKQKELDLEKALYALKEAKSYYLPNVSLNASYTRADGGRTIDLPIGDLMNPVYSTLNQLTASNRFPQINNESVLLNPDNFYDAKIHTTLPLVNLEIGYNKRIKKESINYRQAAINVYKRELVKDIKTAYYRYAQAMKAVDIYKSALLLVNENIRVNESLLRNGARNGTALTRAQTEKQKVEAAVTQQENNAKNAKAYFNFLLNKETDAVINLDSTSNTALDMAPYTANEEIGKREELYQIKTSKEIYGLNTRLQKSSMLPKLNLFLDLGSQAFNFKADSKSLYYFGGLSLQWDLFAGGRNNYRIRQAATEVQLAEAMYSETERALRLQLERAGNNMNTALANYTSAQTQTALAERYYNDQFKVYKEGQLLYIELVDAQNQLTNARLQASVALSEILIAQSELERCRSAYPL